MSPIEFLNDAEVGRGEINHGGCKLKVAWKSLTV